MILYSIILQEDYWTENRCWNPYFTFGFYMRRDLYTRVNRTHSTIEKLPQLFHIVSWLLSNFTGFSFSPSQSFQRASHVLNIFTKLLVCSLFTQSLSVVSTTFCLASSNWCIARRDLGKTIPRSISALSKYHHRACGGWGINRRTKEAVPQAWIRQNKGRVLCCLLPLYIMWTLMFLLKM